MKYKVYTVIACGITHFFMTAHASADETIDAKSCILVAAQKLPVIQGLRVTHSEAVPPPAGTKIPFNVPPGAKIFEVHLTVDAAAQSVTYVGMCETVDGRALADIIGIQR